MLNIHSMLLMFFILWISSYCNAYKLLLVFPVPGKSHSILGESYVRHLLEAGHESKVKDVICGTVAHNRIQSWLVARYRPNTITYPQVTYITPIPIKTEKKGLTQVDVSDNFQTIPPGVFHIENILNEQLNLVDYGIWANIMTHVMEYTLKTKAVQEFLHDPKLKFDAVIVDWLYNELGIGFAAVFDCPYLWSSAMVPNTHVLHLIDQHLNPAYTLNFNTKYSFTFWDRVTNLWDLCQIWYFKRQLLDTEIRIYEESYGTAAALRGRKLPPLEDLRYNGSFMLGNSHACLEDLIALPQNYKDIGGYHIKGNPVPLPQNLQSIMDNARNGAIYFSMGSLLQGRTMPEITKKEILKMLSELNQTVIWKLEEEITDLPENVHVVQWAPQQSILAHSNCVLFITHGGLLSTTEAVNFGVPIIGIPFIADQYLNVERAVNKGFGKKLQFNRQLPAMLKDAIEEILVQNSRYRRRAKEMSKIFNKRLALPGEELVFWVEYVIDTAGAPHLRSAALHVQLYKKLYLDLILVIVVFGLFVILGIKYFLLKRSTSKNKTE